MSTPAVYVVTVAPFTQRKRGAPFNYAAYLSRESADRICLKCLEIHNNANVPFVKRYTQFGDEIERWESDKWIVCIERLALEG